ncbi:MAG: hypothetical protein MUP68_07260, partial [Deltaproteobacteria bacterium]|nr:hypothetical protein [Deltaproteobacteria bacterium]
FGLWVPRTKHDLSPISVQFTATAVSQLSYYRFKVRRQRRAWHGGVGRFIPLWGTRGFNPSVQTEMFLLFQMMLQAGDNLP